MFNRIIFSSIFLLLIVGCSKNPVTGRKQLKLVPEQELQQMANDQYRQFLSSHSVVSSGANAEMVRRVGQRLANSITQFYRSQKLSNVLQGYNWEFKLVNDKSANAWAMPGGKIVVYTGLLPITQNEAALANVLGHEISHSIFQHGNERMSQGLAAQGISTGLSVAMANKPAQTQNIFLQAFGVGATVGVILPFSRKHELEADRFGMRWAAMAGYNPREAINLWQRMEKMSDGNKPPEFVSTHPAEGTRIEQLKKYLPEALKYYKVK